MKKKIKLFENFDEQPKPTKPKPTIIPMPEDFVVTDKDPAEMTPEELDQLRGKFTINSEGYYCNYYAPDFDEKESVGYALPFFKSLIKKWNREHGTDWEIQPGGNSTRGFWYGFIFTDGNPQKRLGIKFDENRRTLNDIEDINYEYGKFDKEDATKYFYRFLDLLLQSNPSEGKNNN